MKNLEHELEVMREQLDEEYDAKQDLERQLSKALADVSIWKTRYETEGLARWASTIFFYERLSETILYDPSRIDEIDRDKSKVAARLSEAEETISQLHEKIAALEKAKVTILAFTEDQELLMTWH